MFRFRLLLPCPSLIPLFRTSVPSHPPISDSLISRYPSPINSYFRSQPSVITYICHCDHLLHLPYSLLQYFSQIFPPVLRHTITSHRVRQPFPLPSPPDITALRFSFPFLILQLLSKPYFLLFRPQSLIQVSPKSFGPNPFLIPLPACHPDLPSHHSSLLPFVASQFFHLPQSFSSVHFVSFQSFLQSSARKSAPFPFTYIVCLEQRVHSRYGSFWYSHECGVSVSYPFNIPLIPFPAHDPFVCV